MISTVGGDTSEERLIDAAHPETAPVLVAAREPNMRYDLDDWGDRLVIRTNADGAADFKIVTAPASAPGRQNWRDLIAHQDGRRIVESVALADHLVRVEREDGLERVVVHRKIGRQRARRHLRGGGVLRSARSFLRVRHAHHSLRVFLAGDTEADL